MLCRCFCRAQVSYGLGGSVQVERLGWGNGIEQIDLFFLEFGQAELVDIDVSLVMDIFEFVKVSVSGDFLFLLGLKFFCVQIFSFLGLGLVFLEFYR